MFQMKSTIKKKNFLYNWRKLVVQAIG
jgi:hypothetical protein